MIEILAWSALALVHLGPAIAALVPGMIERLYGAPDWGTIGILLQHRSVLFAVIVVVCVLAAFDPQARPVATVAASISVIGFLLIYALHGMPAGPLRSIAWVDLAALVPLAIVCWRAWAG